MYIVRKLVLITVCLMFVGCNTVRKEDIPWYVGVAAPQHYNMWVLDMQLEKSGERSWHVPVGARSCCWKGSFGPFGTGGAMEPFPNFIALHWFSFSEQKYYSTLIRMPLDIQKRMREPVKHFNQNGTTSIKPRSTLVLGLAPGGEVVVWMMSQRSNAVEVMRVPAVEVEGNLDAFKARTEEYLEEHGDYLKVNGVPLDGW